MRPHVADDGQAAAVPDAVQGAVEHRQPPRVREDLGDVRLGVTHQALELLTRRFDVGPVDRVRAPKRQPSRWVGQVDGHAAREDGGAPRRHLVEAGRFVPIDEHRPRRPASRQAHADVAVFAGAGQPRLGAQGAVDEGDAAGTIRVGPPVRRERPAVLDQLALDGVGRIIRRLEAGPVCGVEGLDAEGAGPVRRVSGALHPPQSVMRVRGRDTLRAYNDAVTDHDTEKVGQVPAPVDHTA